ncbi:ATP-dependent Clp protease ATP-binding subunit CLPT2, chloroplastic [Carica papaya]|uniref:ATP-dependent Clp protease ATP-binding subunit CLPT2, chloroplastic n=1 Tax=Carica papaya TaxID=3649 RepID=UPI000B8CC9F6|nr:ATP-dependent Clp protease ATP-binding subunit CLPT2, chloroplastic [Carica papaya]
MAAHSLPELHLTNTQSFQSKISVKPDPSSSLVVFSVKRQLIGLQRPWLGINSLRSTSSNPTPTRVRPLTVTVVSTLPTAKPERFTSGEKVPKWSWKAIKTFSMAELEARKLKYATTGTEALLMGILIQGTNPASKFLWENGITLFKVREETVKLLGKGDMYFFSPEHPPLTEDAQRALDWAVDQKLKSGGNGEITTIDVLLGVWSEVESPGHKILATLGFSDEKAKELQSLTSQPGFTDG